MTGGAGGWRGEPPPMLWRDWLDPDWAELRDESGNVMERRVIDFVTVME